MIGPGKYDDECTMVREKTGGTVLLIVLNGNKGQGFSLQTPSLGMVENLADILENVARQLRKDMEDTCQTDTNTKM